MGLNGLNFKWSKPVRSNLIIKTMKNKKKVPYKWYKEIANELARAAMSAKPHIAQLQERIINYPTDFDKERGIPREKLIEWLATAPSPEYKMKLYTDFKAKYEPIKELKGNLKAAKLQATVKHIKEPKFIDWKYDYLHKLADENYLINSEITILMNHMSSLGMIE